MEPFAYRAVDTLANARAALLEHPGAQLIAGGTTLIDLMKAGVERPTVVIDINALPLSAIDVSPDRVRIGALARNSDVAGDATIAREFPLLAQALAAGASGQLRNMATVGGNLLQRTRCSYFRDAVSRCNKRAPGSGCDARHGVNRTHAILGTSESCIATHPSDMAVALAALDAQIVVLRAAGEVRFALDAFYRLPQDAPQHETVLERGDLIVAVEIETSSLHRRSAYLKLRDRASSNSLWCPPGRASSAPTTARSRARDSLSAAWRPSHGARGMPNACSTGRNPRRRCSGARPASP